MNKGGFTLIELIIYIAIVSLVLILSSNFAWDIIQGNTKSNSFREVQQNSRFAIERVSRSLREGNDPGIFTVSEGILYENETPLTTEQVEVTNFRVSPIANTYKINLTVEYNNISGRNEYEAESTLESTVAVLSEGGTPPPPQGCWGIGGDCDTDCQYADYGTEIGYYLEPDPPCNSQCSPAGEMIVNPSGTCSDDGSGNCYKMEDPTSQSIDCNQGEACAEDCRGNCTPCEEIVDPRTCVSQDGCNLLATPGGDFRCYGTCTPCFNFGNEDDCSRQLGCSWSASAWYWNLAAPRSGYFNYTNCQWYE